MGNPCEEHKGDYFNHACYSKLKDYFDNRCLMTEGGWDYLAKSINSLNHKGINTSPYSKLLEEITRLYGGSFAFSQYGVIPSCIYTNYWLNKNIQEKQEYSSLYNKNTFDIFKKFDYYYSKERYNNENNSCKSHLRLLNPEEYHRMHILYLLYSYYDHLGSSKLQNNSDERCTYVSLLAQHYRDISSSLEKYKDIFSQLELLKNLIEKRELHFNLRCSSTFKKITLPKEDAPNPLGHSVEKDTKVSLSVPSETDPTGLQGKSADSRTITDVTLPLSTNPGQTELNPPEKPATELTIENNHLVTPQGGTHYVGRISERVQEEPVVQYTRLPEEKFTEQRVEDVYNVLDGFPYRRPHQVDSDTHPEKSVSPMGQPDDVGLLGKIQSTLSGIVSEVDPAPVLGVSGGMGILFVLFKYTPVGSFFGGRRRRIHQIPSSFRGFPPGDFANFQEYDGGFIGYGPMNMNPLAE